jgi:hypothetical protein
MTLSITIPFHYAKCRVLFTIMLNVIMLSVAMMNVIMLSVAMLNVIMLSVAMLNAIMLSVMAPNKLEGLSLACFFMLWYYYLQAGPDPTRAEHRKVPNYKCTCKH